MRDEFLVSAKDELAKRVAYQCSNPRCRRPTSGPQEAPTGTVNIGVAAHITSAAPGGPRYNPALTPAGRGTMANGIWLCQSCAKLIDSDVGRYTIRKLVEWKDDAEFSARTALEEARDASTPADSMAQEAERLMADLISEMRVDVRGDETELVRDFVVLPSRNVVFPSRMARFFYTEDEVPNLRLKVTRLEEMGLVADTTTGSAPTYRLTPGFADWLRRHG